MDGLDSYKGVSGTVLNQNMIPAKPPYRAQKATTTHATPQRLTADPAQPHERPPWKSAPAAGSLTYKYPAPSLSYLLSLHRSHFSLIVAREISSLESMRFSSLLAFAQNFSPSCSSRRSALGLAS